MLAIHHGFERRAESAPSREALLHAGSRLAYDELNRRANRAAHLLLRCGIARGDRVAVLLPRTVDLVVTLLAVLKCGASYIPLDPAYPAERTAFVIADAQARAVVTTTALASALDAAGAELLLLDASAGRLALQPATNPAVQTSARDLAYVIYTSGSTGRPKGVMIEHAAACARLDWARAAFSDDELGGMLASTSICFDLSVFEIFAPLWCGGRVLLASNALELPELPYRDEIRLVNTVPSAMRALLELDALPAGVRTVCLAGEQFPRSVARALGARRHVTRIVNLYGPTEDTTYSTCAEVRPDGDEPPPIGRPLPGTRAYVLDESGRPCPAGVAGELHLGGVGLARGYWNRPEQTAERFVCDAFSDAAGARMYRTGDRVRAREDGELEYVGRLDDQVKVRGYRVEIGEIEHALGRHPGAGQCAVALAGLPSGDSRLVAFYTGAAPGPSLREHLAASLPAYMVPASFVRVQQIPRTPNGKLDRSRLLAEDRMPPGATGARHGAPPDSPVELVARIVADALGVASIDRDANLPELGVHSLLATRILARVRAETGRDVSLAAVFDSATVTALAACVANAPARTSREPSPGDPRAGAPLSAAQKQMWFAAQLDPRDGSYNVPFTIRIAGAVEPALLERALNEVVRRHAALRTRVETRDGRPWQVADDGVTVAVATADLSAVPPDERDAELRRRALALAAEPLDLARAPLLRAASFRLGDEDWRLVLVVHHAVFDDWSLAVVVRDLAAVYDAFERAGVPAASPALRFADYCAWQNVTDWSAGTAYFRERLTGAPAVLELSAARPRPARPGTDGATESFALGDDVARLLDVVAARERTTPFAVLLATFQLLLAESSGCDDFVTLTAVAGRTHRSAEDIVGCFINLVPLRASVRGDEPFSAMLARVTREVFDALDHQQTPFERIVEAVRPPRDPRWTPVGQIAFGVQNGPEPVASHGGRTWSGSELRTDRARLDVSLWIDRRAGPLRASWTYRTDLFTSASIARLHARYAHLLGRVVREPQTRIAALGAPQESKTMPDNASRKSFPGRAAPKAFGAAQLAALEPGRLPSPLPGLVRAQVRGLDLAAWAGAHRALIDDQLARGGVLFRGFRVETAADFQAFARAVSTELIRYGERSSPRTEIADGVYTSTDHPADQPIVLHNEQSYTLNWPMRILFFCGRAAAENGRTPLADSRKILARLSPATVERFERLGVLYVRNYVPGLSLPWTEVFQTHDRGEVERYCESASVEFEWVGGERLRTRQRRPAVRRHPVSGERTWFNHALFFHVTSLPPDVSRSLRGAVRDADLPYNTYYGDGSPIDDVTLRELRDAYDAETVRFDWENGDVLLLDNMLVAHGREPFTGPREVRAAMVDPYASLYGVPERMPGPRAEAAV